MTRTETPAPAALPTLDEQYAAIDRRRARAAAIDAHADGIVPSGRNPITGAETASHEAWQLAQTIDDARGMKALAQMAERRTKVQWLLRTFPQGSADRILTDSEAQGLAFRALAALGREADERHDAGINPPSYMTVINGCYPVGPYVTDAVSWVMCSGRRRGGDIAATKVDREIVTAWALMLNVATR